jgi:sulfur-oxidizing protein SoxA
VKRPLHVFLLVLLAGSAAAQERTLPLAALRSGIAFSGPDVQALQADDAANPGMLWVQRGGELWTAAAPGGSCASCHRDAPASMRGVAARYPAFDKSSGDVVDLEARINACRTQRQRASAWPRDAEDLLALTAYIAYQSRGMPLAVSIDGPARVSFDRGRAIYFKKHGQLNLACTHCHDQNWGKRLLAENISQGHGNAFPAYRLEWQSVGSLQRRIRACYFGIRAEMPPPGARELTDLELYLAWRAQGLPIEAPGVRR